MKLRLLAGAVTILALSLVGSKVNAQSPTVSVQIQNNAWYVYNTTGQVENVVFATPSGIAFGSSFSVAPGTPMPIMGPIGQPYRWFACYAPYNPIDLNTGRYPTFGSYNVGCR